MRLPREIDAYIVVEAKDTEEGQKECFYDLLSILENDFFYSATMIEEKLERYKERVSRRRGF